MWQAEKYEIMCISGEENNKSIHSCPVAKFTGISFVKVKGRGAMKSQKVAEDIKTNTTYTALESFILC